jgi:hypothetical protein
MDAVPNETSVNIEGNEIRTNRERNRLYLFLTGFWSDELAITVTDRIEKEAAVLKPGFSIINDISTLRPATPSGAERIKACQTWLAAHGAKRIVRIVCGGSTVTKLQFARTSKDLYEADTASSIEEAERMLGD